MVLQDMASELGVDLTEEQASLMEEHLELLVEKNKVMNLTRIVDIDDARVLHLLDSLTFVTHVNQTSGRVLDIGTGGGFPGLPIAIATGREVLCIDAVGKKTDAVNSFIMELGISNCSAKHIRAEELARREHYGFGCVVARAVDKLSSLIEYAAPLLSLGGRVVLSKGNLLVEEYDACIRAAKVCGIRIVDRTSFDLPQGLGHREVIVGERFQKPSIALPRQNGKAHRVPLGY